MKSNAASGCVVKISMLRLNIGSGSALDHAFSGLGSGSGSASEETAAMHELSLSMPEPMLSLSVLILTTQKLRWTSPFELMGHNMLILATTSGFSQRDGFRQAYSNFSNRLHPLAQNRCTIQMGIVLWRVAEKTKIAIWVGRPPPPPGVKALTKRPPPLGG